MGKEKLASKNLKSKKIMEEEMVRWKEKITIINITTTINTNITIIIITSIITNTSIIITTS